MLSFVKVKIINKLANLTLKLKDVEKNSEAGSFHSNQKYDLTPPHAENWHRVDGGSRPY